VAVRRRPARGRGFHVEQRGAPAVSLAAIKIVQLSRRLVERARTVRGMDGAPTFRLEPPRLRTTADPSEERHATWFELYFDLVFVAAVAQLAAALARDPTGPVFARFAGLFVVVTWAWAGFTFYANRFDTDDLIFRLAKSGAMLAIAALAVDVHRVMAGHGGGAEFAAAYVVVRSLLVALYVRARLHVHGPGRELINVYIAAFSFTTLLWLFSIFVPGPFRYVLWGLALAIDVLTPLRAWPALAGAPVVVSHLTDRYGSFFIIVLGESVVAVVAGVAGFGFSFQSWVVAVSCFVIALCLWWIYFDLADTSVLGRGTLGLTYLYGHFPLLAGVAAFGAGTKLAITHAAQAGLDAGVRWALAGGVAAFALSLALFYIGAEWTSPRDRTFLGRVALAALLITLAAAGAGVAPLAFVALVAAAVLGQLILEAFTYPLGAASVWEPPEPVDPLAAPGYAGLGATGATEDASVLQQH
jgi:low temperature requirement protein LtrA